MAEERRNVRVDEPGLSDDTNQALTDNLRAAVGGDEVTVPEDAGGSRMPRRRSSFIATLSANRLVLIITFLSLLVVGAIVSLATGSWWFLLVAVAVHAIATVVMAAGVLQSTTQVERPDPVTVEKMEAEGIPDPEGRFNDIVEEFGGAGAARGTPELVSPGNNERTASAQDEPARAAVEQRTALTPGAEAERPGGESSAIAFLPWYVVGALIVLSVVFAIAVGGKMWIASAVIVPLGVAWIVIDRLMSARGEDAAPNRPAGDHAGGRRRLAAVGAAIVVVAIAVVAVIVVVALA